MLLGLPRAISMHNFSLISGKCSGHQCAHLGNVQAGAQATAILRNWLRRNPFSLKAIAVKFKAPITILNVCKSKYGVCSLKDEGYTEWRTGPRFQHQTASIGRYEMAAILFSDIESYWK